MTETAANTVLPGRRLQAAREKLGWNEADVARKLHMSVSFVRAIEADDYERLPEATFIKGYMRNYARLLEIPADEVANLFEQLVDEEQYEEPQDLEQPASSTARPWWLVVAAAVLAALLLAWMIWPEPQAPVAPASDVQQVQPDNMPMREETGLPTDDSAALTPAPATDEELPLAPPAAETQAPESAKPAATASDRLLMAFSGPCWVQVLDAEGETLFSGQREAGAELALSGVAPFRLTFGNGAAVASVSVNGESVTLPQSTPGNVVRVRAP
ncbi:MAG: RodZ domain-containing protein [Alcanivoracaceae bacterium]